MLAQVIKESTRNDALLDLILRNKEELVMDVEVRSSLGCSHHEMMELRILKGTSRAKSRTAALDFRRSLEICLEESHGLWPWREEKSMRAH